ncbi:MAG: hypothetical protein GC131_07035 [Alphaproteobacteria bacterium]|nr:hypothetical protein [Alphaproteobacteria bacterium]
MIHHRAHLSAFPTLPLPAVALAFFAALTLSAQPAQAAFKQVGFKWVAPVEQSQPPVIIGNDAPSVYVPPGDYGYENESLPPLVIEGNDRSQMPSVSSLPAQGSSGVLEGFADNVPLQVALRQIVPAGYAVAPEANVDMGVLVNWRGGRPWQDVLQGMLNGVGLESNVSGQTVKIALSQNRMAPVGLEPLPQQEDALAPLPATTVGEATVMEPMTPMQSMPMTEPAMPAAPAQTGMMRGGVGQVVVPQLPSDIAATWTAERGKSLHDVIEEWCRRDGVELVWSAEYDYPLQASLSFTGTFEDALRGALGAFARVKPQPFGRLHSNSDAGQRVLVVEARGNNYGE